MPKIEHEFKTSGVSVATIAFERFAPETFRVATEAIPASPKIEQGRWVAECRKIFNEEDVSAPRKWTMCARYDGDVVDLRFYAIAHPENKYPPSEAVPSPVMLAGFLEYCQALAAKDTKRTE